MSYWRSPNCCELCRQTLVGTAEISTSIEGEQSVLTVRQSRLINWSFCYICRSVVCRITCFDPASGCCRACANDADVKPVDFNERSAADTGDDILSAETIF